MLFTQEILDEINRHTKGKEHVKLSVGIIKGDEQEVKLFGVNGEESYQNYYYEIGSITKTFTGILLSKAIEEGKVCLDDSISKYISELDENNYYPTLRRLVSHTSGCPSDPEEYDTDSRFRSENPFNNFNRMMLIGKLKTMTFENKDYPFNYSNFGCSLVGYVLEMVYKKEFDVLMKELLEELDLSETFSFNPIINLNGYDNENQNCGNYSWTKESAFCPAGYLYSNASDMLLYAKKQFSGNHSFIERSHKGNVAIHKEPLVEIGMFWVKYTDKKIIYHTGGSGCFNSILCIDLDKKNAIVMLSNYYDESNFNFAIRYLNRIK